MIIHPIVVPSETKTVVSSETKKVVLKEKITVVLSEAKDLLPGAKIDNAKLSAHRFFAMLRMTILPYDDMTI
jgi:hypothetical protein